MRVLVTVLVMKLEPASPVLFALLQIRLWCSYILGFNDCVVEALFKCPVNTYRSERKKNVEKTNFFLWRVKNESN